MSTTITSVTVPYSTTTVFPSSSSVPNVNTKVFFGFSTIDTEKTGKTTLYDVALIERDLLNAFYTRVGERVMRPDWGCKLWDYLFEPMTPDLFDKIVAEVTRICQSDTRVVLLDQQVFQYENGMRIEMLLQYLPYNVQNTFTATFNQQENAYFSNNSDS
jgi:phage baseplate assembly protein W